MESACERKSAEGFSTAFKPVDDHFKNAEFVCGAEPVFDGPHNPVGMLSRAFEIENGVDNVLERLRTGDRAIFCDVPDQKTGT